MFCLHVGMCERCLSGALGGQMRASDPLELELQRAGSQVGAENGPWVSVRAASALYYQATSPGQFIHPSSVAECGGSVLGSQHYKS